MKISDINYIFYKTDLKYVIGINLNRNYVFNMSHMFQHCHSLLPLDFISEWDTKNVFRLFV